MNIQTSQVWDALRVIYGENLQAATVTMLLKDTNDVFRFVTTTIPQKEKNT